MSEPCPPARHAHRRVHCPLPKPEGSAEGTAFGEGRIHQPVGSGQGGDEGKPHTFVVQALANLGWDIQVELLFLQVKLLELQELVLRLVNERNEWQGKFLAVSQNPGDVPTPVPTGSQEFGAADQQGGE